MLTLAQHATNSLTSKKRKTSTTSKKPQGSSNARSDPTKLCFLDLPGEVRNEVYAHVLLLANVGYHEGISSPQLWVSFAMSGLISLGYCEVLLLMGFEPVANEAFVVKHISGLTPGLLRASKQIHHEAASFLYSRIEINIHGTPLDSVDSLVDIIGPTNSSYIRHLNFSVSSCGGPDLSSSLWYNSFVGFANLTSLKFKKTLVCNEDQMPTYVYEIVRMWVNAGALARDKALAMIDRITHESFEPNETERLTRKMRERAKDMIAPEITLGSKESSLGPPRPGSERADSEDAHGSGRLQT